MIRPVRISFFGIGRRIMLGTFDEFEWTKLNLAAKQLKMKLTSAIFDPSFYELVNNNNFKSVYDLGNIIDLYGLINNYKSSIQVQVYRKRRRNIQFNEIINSPTLFPLYNVKTIYKNIKFKKRTILVIEEDIGQLSKYIVNSPFSLEKLVFEITNLSVEDINSDMQMITALNYDTFMLDPLTGNSLVTKQYALVSKGS